MRRVVDSAARNIQPKAEDEIDRDQSANLCESGAHAALNEWTVCPLRAEGDTEESKHAT